jgi:hypothetical protein
MTTTDFSSADRTALCNAAQAAWDADKPTARKVRFTWKGKPYVSTLTSFRMLVDRPSGERVCCRWF